MVLMLVDYLVALKVDKLVSLMVEMMVDYLVALKVRMLVD